MEFKLINMLLETYNDNATVLSEVQSQTVSGRDSGKKEKKSAFIVSQFLKLKKNENAVPIKFRFLNKNNYRCLLCRE